MYKYRFNNKLLKNRRRELRINQTEAEGKLWEFIRSRKLNGFKFYRQFSIGGHVLDFYCPKIRLGIELDGNLHVEKEKILYDEDRTRILQSSNIQIIRFWNNDVLDNIETVLGKINNALDQEGSIPPLLN